MGQEINIFPDPGYSIEVQSEWIQLDNYKLETTLHWDISFLFFKVLIFFLVKKIIQIILGWKEKQ